MASFDFHKEGVWFLRTRPEGRALLGDEPGLGKSRQLLLAAEGRTLVIAPAMVLDGGVWDDEIAKWRPDLDVTQVSYSSLNARVKTGANASATRPILELRPEYRGHWDTVIADECHYLKGRKTTWTEAALKLDVDRFFLATGTPIPNWAYELFIPLKILHPGEAEPGGKYGSYWRWVKEWFEMYATRFNPYNIGGLREDRTWEEFHRENLGDLFLQRLRDDVLTDLPPLTDVWMDCPMGPDQRRIYKELKKDFVAMTDAGMVIAWNSAAQTVKLAQAATGLMSRSRKMEVLVELVKDRTHPTLVVAHFKATCERAAQELQAEGRTVGMIHGDTGRAERKAVIAEFKAGRLDVLVASIGVISEGLTLTQADTVIFVEHSWSPHKNEQAKRRIHRIGQLRPVSCIHLVTPNTIDARMLKVLEQKTEEQIRALRPAELRELA